MKFIYNALASLISNSNVISGLKRATFVTLSNNPSKAINAVLSATGEVSSIVYSEHLLSLFENLEEKNKIKVLKNLVIHYDIDSDALIASVKKYSVDPSESAMNKITQLAEPAWVLLFRRLNATSEGTVRLVRLREHLLKAKKNDSDLGRLDVGLLGLFKTLFNPGFLVLQPIDWSTPAAILEKIIAYEAVHEIGSWEELRARLAPEDRRCFAFFHLAMPDEPLIFVEVALTDKIPDSIEKILTDDREYLREEDATTAVFYSISNCQDGLIGVSFGNFLLKQVIQRLKEELPDLTTYVTLSPVPGFNKWLSQNNLELSDSLIKQKGVMPSIKLKKYLFEAMAEYLLISDRTDNAPNDPVARFHLGNGATIGQFNFLGDVSERGMRQSTGMMVNYIYELNTIEKNHEEYAKNNKIIASSNIRKLLKT